MAMGSILWEQGAYSALEQLFRQSAEFCSEHDSWKLNVAHTFFMQVRQQCAADRGCRCACCMRLGGLKLFVLPVYCSVPVSLHL